MQPPLEAAIATGIDLGDLDCATSANSSADQRRAAMAGDVEARLPAGLDVQVLDHAAGDVGRPAHVAPRVSQRLGEVHDVDAVGRGQIGERDHIEASGWPHLVARSS